MLIFGKKSNESYIMRNPTYRLKMDETQELNKDYEWCLNEIYNKFNISSEDISCYFVSNLPGSEIIERILIEDEFNLEWTNNEISGLDFSKEDNKGYFSVETDKNLIDVSGTVESGTAVVTLTVLDKDKNINTSYNDTIYVSCKYNIIGKLLQKVTFVNGISSINIKKNDNNFLGLIQIPFGNKYADENKSLRIYNIVNINIYRG